MKRLLVISVVLLTALLVLLVARQADAPGDGFEFLEGAVNGVIIERDGVRLAVYGQPDAGKTVDQVLLTHHRRDVVWPARNLTGKLVAPAAERALIEAPADHWTSFAKSRFHDYGQQSTKVLGAPLAAGKDFRWVKEGDAIDWHGLKFHVADTPGYTRGAVSYVVDLDGKRVAFTGDLIYGDGQLIDLFSLQDEIPEAKIRGYHGYASRLAMLIESLQKVAATEPDFIVPARGPIIRNPQQAIDRLIGRVREIYRNYLSTNALNWYFKEERMRICGERVLGPKAEVQLMSYSQHEKAPPWVWENSTSRLLISDKGHGLLLDCGYQRVIDAVKQLIKEGRISKVDGIFVTHCHDDHTDYVQAAATEFGCPVYALKEYADVLERPEAYHLPALTTNAIAEVRAKKNGDKMAWDEFELTFHYYPGQMLHHGALLVEKAGAKPIFFIGDSFSPSGLDDYCLQNRNLVHDDSGYFLCLKKLREFRGNYWLINEHIPFVFTFSDQELDYLESRYRKRRDVLRDLFPWDDPNYGIDEQWAVFYPYAATVAPGKDLEMEVRVTNHSPRQRTFTVTPRAAGGLKATAESSVTIGPRKSGRVRVRVQAPAESGFQLLTADVSSEGMHFRDWIEAMIQVE